MFEEMLMAQHDLQTRVYGYDFQAMTDEERVQYIKDMMLGIQAELKEMLDEVNWKSWTTETGINNLEAYLGEAVDVWHFLMNLLLATGLGPYELTYQFYRRYYEKAKLNAKRQEDGYDSRSTKCGHCGRALDDPAVACTREGDQGYCAGTDSDINYIKSS